MGGHQKSNVRGWGVGKNFRPTPPLSFKWNRPKINMINTNNTVMENFSREDIENPQFSLFLHFFSGLHFMKQPT